MGIWGSFSWVKPVGAWSCMLVPWSRMRWSVPHSHIQDIQLKAEPQYKASSSGAECHKPSGLPQRRRLFCLIWMRSYSKALDCDIKCFFSQIFNTTSVRTFVRNKSFRMSRFKFRRRHVLQFLQNQYKDGCKNFEIRSFVMKKRLKGKAFLQKQLDKNAVHKTYLHKNL